MTADWARLPYDLLETISSRIVNEVPGINRLFTTLPPSHQLRSMGVLSISFGGTSDHFSELRDLWSLEPC